MLVNENFIRNRRRIFLKLEGFRGKEKDFWDYLKGV